MLWESCNFSYTEHNKIGFAISGFLYDFIRILQGAAETLKRGRNLFASRPLKDLKSHSSILGLRPQP
jgi:hypothetical protein